MVAIPEKLQNQLKDLVKDKFITIYTKRSTYDYYHTTINVKYEISKSVLKTIRPMDIQDLFKSHVCIDDDQRTLKLLYEAEKTVEEYEILKQSLHTVKSTLGTL